MSSKNFYFERDTEYYIWWLLNSYSQENVGDKQIKKEISSLINKIEYFCKNNGTSLMCLYTLTEMRLFDYNIEDYKEYKEDYARAEAQSEEEFQEEFREAYREEVRETYREEWREVYREESRKASREMYQKRT
jgi:cyclopropane fatty-acyl-phospholipid synthase-like methyltransferase